MTSPVPVTLFVSNDELAEELYEIPKVAPDGRGIRRYRFITVYRDDAPAQYVEDMGPAKPDEEPIACLSKMEHTVGELIDMANRLREKPFDMEEVPRRDIIGQFYDEAEQRYRVATGQAGRTYH